MDQKAAPQETGFVLPIPRWEFIALAAGLIALNALAIDIMLPGLQQIGASLGVENENHRQYVITAYILGFGGAQLVFGPLSDHFGRRGPLLVGLAIYVAAALSLPRSRRASSSCSACASYRASAQPPPAS